MVHYYTIITIFDKVFHEQNLSIRKVYGCQRIISILQSFFKLAYTACAENVAH